jgi:hypothetical protein
MGIFGWPWKKSKRAPESEKPAEASQAAESKEPEPRQDMCRIPEGFMVRTWDGECDFPSLLRLDGGILLVRIGRGGDGNVKILRAVFDAVDRALERPHRPALIAYEIESAHDLLKDEPPVVVSVEESVVWTLQEGILDGWGDDPRRLQELLQRFHGFESRKGSARIVQTVCVKKPYFDEVSAILGLIQGLGIDIRELSPHDPVLIEVHRPDGPIVSGILGQPHAPIGNSAGFQPRRLNEEKSAAAARGDGAMLTILDNEEMRLLESAIRSSAPGQKPRTLVCAPMLRWLISETARGNAECRKKLHAYFLDQKTPLVVPARDRSGDFLEARMEGSQGEAALTVFPDLDSVQQLGVLRVNDPFVPMQPDALLNLCRTAGLALILRMPSRDGPLSVTVHVQDVDTLAAARKAP